MRSLVLCLVLFCQGCASLPPPEPEGRAALNLTLPETWMHVGSSNDGDVIAGWLRTFDDSRLEQLVAEALEHSRNLKVASARLQIAKEAAILGRAQQFPTIGASGSGSGTDVRVRDQTGELQPWRFSEDYNLALSLSWEIDIWGRIRHLRRAAAHDLEAARADYRAARLSLAANTAKAWCNLIASRQQVELAIQTKDSFERNYRVTERNYRAGDVTASPLDVQFGRNNVAQAGRSLISRELFRNDAARALEVLLGRYPAATIDGRDDLPALRDEVPAGLPANLLLRRPDLAAAAAAVRASAERARAAQKDLLPSIVLTARGSTASDELSNLIADPRSILWNVAGSLSQPLYRGGSLRARARQTRDQNEAALQTFAATALRAFQEVESTLNADRSLAAQEKFLETELAQANLAEIQASRDYSEGIVGILAVLEAQRRAFSARNAMIALKNQRLQNRIDLHLALGGDFETLPAGGNQDTIGGSYSTGRHWRQNRHTHKNSGALCWAITHGYHERLHHEHDIAA